MNGTVAATYIGAGVSCFTALLSGLAWWKTRKYYRRFVLVEDIGNLNKCKESIEKCIKLYRQVLSLLGNDRGKNGDDGVKKKMVTMKGHIQDICNALPSKFFKRIEVDAPQRYIDKIISGKEKCKHDDDFMVLQSQLNEIMNQLKVLNDELRGAL